MIKAIVLLIVLTGVSALIFQVSNYDRIVITEVQCFDERLLAATVESVTVFEKERMLVAFRGGMGKK
jgi:hypothetical protein